MAIRTLSEHSVLMAIHFFVNFDAFNRCISVKTSLNNTKHGDFVNHCVLFLTIYVNQLLLIP